MKISIQNLKLLLNKDDYCLAMASLSDLNLLMEIRDDILNTQGSIRTLSLEDKTKFGDKYPHKLIPKDRVDPAFAEVQNSFTVRSKKENFLSFSLMKYGQKDLTGYREFDMKVEAKLMPVYYTHTNRFFTELISYLVHITQLLEVAQRGYDQGLAEASRQGKIMLDISLREGGI